MTPCLFLRQKICSAIADHRPMLLYTVTSAHRGFRHFGLKKDSIKIASLGTDNNLSFGSNLCWPKRTTCHQFTVDGDILSLAPYHKPVANRPTPALASRAVGLFKYGFWFVLFWMGYFPPLFYFFRTLFQRDGPDLTFPVIWDVLQHDPFRTWRKHFAIEREHDGSTKWMDISRIPMIMICSMNILECYANTSVPRWEYHWETKRCSAKQERWKNKDNTNGLQIDISKVDLRWTFQRRKPTHSLQEEALEKRKWMDMPLH